MSKTFRILLPLAVAAAVTALWYALRWQIGRHAAEKAFTLPYPHEVLSAGYAERAVLLEAAANTALPALAGFAGAIVFSILASLALASSTAVRAALFPYVMAMQMIPIIVITPILLLWVGSGLFSVTIITFLISCFPLVVATTQGLISTDRNLVDLFRLSRASRWQETIRLRLPSALPYFFTGLRVSAILAPIGAVTGDFFAGNSAGGVGGLGFRTVLYSAHLKVPALFATAATCCLLGFILVGAVYFVSWLLLHKWHDSYGRTDV
jgi:NitT/TauT family transport system permease protein